MIIVVIIVMKTKITKKERNKKQGRQVIHNAIAHHLLSDALSFPEQ